MRYIKYIKRQDSGWKQQAGYSGETSINLSIEISEYLTFGLVSSGEEQKITFLLYKQDFISALEFIKSQLPLYRSTSHTYELVKDEYAITKIHDILDTFFEDEDIVEYTVTLYNRKDGRIYLKGLKQRGFTIRDYLVENSSALLFQDNDGIFELRLLSAVNESFL